MNVLNHLGQAAAIILLLELLVVLIVFLAIAGGLAFGSHWVNGKTEWAFGKVNTGNDFLRRWIHRGTGIAVTPLILALGWGDRVRATVGGVREQVRQLEARRTPQLEVASRLIPPPEPAEEPEAPVPLV